MTLIKWIVIILVVLGVIYFIHKKNVEAAAALAAKIKLDTATVQKYTKQLIDTIEEIDKVSKISGTFGKIGDFYVIGQATIPSDQDVTKIIDTQHNKTSIDCVNNAPKGTTVFVYNPQTQTCTYYTGKASLSNLSVGTYTVGSTTF